MRDVRLRESLPRDLTWLVGLALTWITGTVLAATRLGQDSHAYWAAWRGTMYGAAPGSLDAYNYSPAFAQVLWPVAHLPWPAFGLIFGLVGVAVLVHLFRPLGWSWVVPLLLCCSPEILSGNIFWLLALVAAYGLRWPALWAVPLLTKVTPGLGPLWFALRREWAECAVSIVATLGVVAVSAAAAPHLWLQWLDFLLTNQHGTQVATGSSWFPPLVVRLPFALALLVWSALTDRRWGLPAAMVLATPVSGIAAFTILAALPRLQQAQSSARTTTRSASTGTKRSVLSGLTRTP